MIVKAATGTSRSEDGSDTTDADTSKVSAS